MPVEAAAVATYDASLSDAQVEALPEPERVSFLERLLIRRLQKGDARAYRDLVRKHQDRVYSLCLRMLGDKAEAEDLTQEVFISVHRHLGTFRGDSKLSTWIFRVAKNQCLNRLKYNERRETDGDDDLHKVDAGTHGGTFVARSDRPDEAMLANEERDAVQRAMQTLSAEHRLLVVLRDIEGMSYEEVARIADLPAGTVKSRLHRARAALAIELERVGMGPDAPPEEEERE